MTENNCRQATPHADLMSELMDSRRAKSEREHAAAREIESLRARVAELEAALAEAVDDIEYWGAYADPYFKEKWNLAGDLERYRKVLTKGQEE